MSMTPNLIYPPYIDKEWAGSKQEKAHLLRIRVLLFSTFNTVKYTV